MKSTQYSYRLAMGLVLSTGLAIAPVQAIGQNVVHVAQGRLQGKAEAGVEAYLGIPYAAPPTGDRRWRAPASPDAWNGVRKADRFSPSCMQVLANRVNSAWTREYGIPGPMSEDCLYLNVWRPKESRHGPLPVLVWIHGGGFVQGSASVPIYDGAALARQGVVVVSINYRLNIFGFLGHPDLTAESRLRTSGNYALQDQVAALRWVRANIAAFGGDPDQVTVAGQSAGAASVHALMAMPSARGLFRRAISQSGAGLNLAFPTLSEMEERGTAYAKVMHAASIAELRALPAEALLNTPTPPSSRQWSPVIDGTVLPKRPDSDDAPDVAVLTGLTGDEGSGFLGPRYGALTRDAVPGRLEADFGSLSARAGEIYRAQSDADAGEVGRQIVRDRGLAATYLWARDRTARTGSPAYVYYFRHVEPGPQSSRWGAFHSSEIPYVFYVLRGDGRTFGEWDRKLAGYMGQYWGNFVKTGDPNDAGLPNWPVFVPEAPVMLDIGTAIAPKFVLDPAKMHLYLKYKRNGGALSIF